MPKRRAILASMAASAAVLAGCISSDSPDTDTTRSPQMTTTTPEGSTKTTDNRTEDATKYDQVVMENRTGEEHVVHVAVEQDGETFHEEAYRVPIETGLRIEQQFDWGTHAVRASVDDGEERTREWEHGSCASTPHSDGNQNLGVVIEDENEGEDGKDGEDGGRWSFVKNGCDYLNLGEVYVAEYESASGHEAESTTTTSSS